MKYFFDSLENESKANKKIFAKTNLIQNVTEDIMIAMEDLNISKAEFAKRIGKSKSYITQILSGSRNMTLSSLSDVCFELGIEPQVKILSDEQRIDKTEINDSKVQMWEKSPQEFFGQYQSNPIEVIPITTHPKYKRAA